MWIACPSAPEPAISAAECGLQAQSSEIPGGFERTLAVRVRPIEPNPPVQLSAPIALVEQQSQRAGQFTHVCGTVRGGPPVDIFTAAGTIHIQ